MAEDMGDERDGPLDAAGLIAERHVAEIHRKPVVSCPAAGVEQGDVGTDGGRHVAGSDRYQRWLAVRAALVGQTGQVSVVRRLQPRLTIEG